MIFSELSAGDVLPGRSYCPDEVQLFMYNAAIWNPHRIHYDYPYTTEVEGHPGIVIDGPLQGDYLTQLVLEWANDRADLISFRYTNRKAAYLGQTLHTRGRVTDIDRESGEVGLEIAVLNDADEVLTPGIARVRFRQPRETGLPPV